MPFSSWSSNYRGALTQSVRYESVGLTLDPPLSRTAAVLPDQADEAFRNADAVWYDAPADSVLALATVHRTGSANPNGSIDPLLESRLVYAVIWEDLECRSSGGPALPNRPTTPPPPSVCTAVTLVDALSGKGVFSFISTNP